MVPLVENLGFSVARAALRKHEKGNVSLPSSSGMGGEKEKKPWDLLNSYAQTHTRARTWRIDFCVPLQVGPVRKIQSA